MEDKEPVEEVDLDTLTDEELESVAAGFAITRVSVCPINIQ